MKGTQSSKKRSLHDTLLETPKSTSDNPLYEGTSDFRPAFKRKEKKKKKKKNLYKEKKNAGRGYGHRR